MLMTFNANTVSVHVSGITDSNTRLVSTAPRIECNPADAIQWVVGSIGSLAKSSRHRTTANGNSTTFERLLARRGGCACKKKSEAAEAAQSGNG